MSPLDFEHMTQEEGWQRGCRSESWRLLGHIWMGLMRMVSIACHVVLKRNVGGPREILKSLIVTSDFLGVGPLKKF